MIGAALLFSALLAQTQPAASAATAAVSTPEKARAENRQMMQQEFDGHPRRESRPVSKIVKITLDDGHIHVQPLLDPTDGNIECDPTDWPGRLEVNISPPETLQVQLKHIRLSDDDTTMTMTEVSTQPDYLQINRSTESMTGLTSVTLIQSRKFEDEEHHNPTRLTVQQTSDDAATDPPQIQLSAESFAKLRQEHPAEVRTYLLPILRDLGAGALLLASDRLSAWQVLGRDIAVDPALDGKLNDVLKLFDADDFATRAKAEDKLAALGPAGAAALERRDLAPLSFDTRAAVDNFFHAMHPMTVTEAQAASTSVDFLLDTILLKDPTLRDAAIARLAKVTGHPIDLATDLPDAEREKRVEAYRTKFAPATQP